MVGLLAIVAVVVIAAVVMGDRLGGGGDEEGPTAKEGTPTPAGSVTPPDESATAEKVLERYIQEKLGQEYVGDCTASILPKGEGRVCSAVKGERGNRKAYIIGPSSFEFDLWVFLERKNGTWQVYGVQEVKPETADVPGAPWPLEVGAEVVVAGTGTCLNVRSAPGIQEAAVDCLADGTEIVLEEGPVEADGFQWWRPEGRGGWVAGDWLRYAEEEPEATEAPGTPGPTRSPTPEE